MLEFAKTLVEVLEKERMINKTVEGDLLYLFSQKNYDAIVQGCNCFCTMGKGIALQIRQQYPKAYEVDLLTSFGNKNKLGTYTFCEYPEGIIINAYTQYDCHRGVNVDYEAITKVFYTLNKNFKGCKIGIPKIGAGLAGGDWNIISSIINENTPDLDIELVVWREK